MSEKTKQPKKVVLLDLDGTLTKSDPGIIGCVVKVFEELGYPVPDDEELQRFIGPAIVESLQRNNIPDDLLDEGIAIYRRYYAQEAVFDDPNNPGQKVPGRLNNTIYDGIPEQLVNCVLTDTTWRSQAASRSISAFRFASISIWTPWSTAFTVPAKIIRVSTKIRLFNGRSTTLGLTKPLAIRRSWSVTVGPMLTEPKRAVWIAWDAAGVMPSLAS